MNKPVIDEAKCTGCGDCEPVCPVSHFKLKGDKMKVVKPEQECIGCKACVYACPREAITISEGE